MSASSPIPEPRLTRLRNLTPFKAFGCQKAWVGRIFYDTIVVKGTFALAPGQLSPAGEQLPISFVDEPWDPANAERSSLKQAGEVLLGKPATDVMVTGTARAPSHPLREWDAGVEVRRRGETLLAYRAQALGPRAWRHTTAKGWVLTDPEPTLEVPIRYELAYGGVSYRPNPSGTGFFDEGAMDTALEYRAPQWQPRARPVTGLNREVPLTGFGPVARPWASRYQYAGTYDDAWMRRMRSEVAQGLPSDYAEDIDPRFFQCAHPELIAKGYLRGDEEIVLTGLVPGPEPFSLELPGVALVAGLLDGKEESSREALVLDTVHVDLDAAKVSLCWRLTIHPGRDIRAAALVLMEVA